MPLKQGDKPVVLISRDYYKRGRSAFDLADDFRLILVPADEETLAAEVKLHQPFAVVIGPEPYSGPLYNAMANESVLARFGVGYDGVDLKQAEANGIQVTNTPDVLDSTVAELTLFLAGELLRMPGSCSRDFKEGRWQPYSGRELKGKTWAILGLGRIGKELSKMLSFGFGVRVFALKRDVGKSDELKKLYGVERVSSGISDIIPEADIVSVLLPSVNETFHYCDKSFFDRMKPGSFFINTSRGALVNENDLYDSLLSGQLAGAALDVYEKEPYVPFSKAKDLRTLPNIIMTPHIGSNASECTTRMAERVLQNLRYAHNGDTARMDIVS